MSPTVLIRSETGADVDAIAEVTEGAFRTVEISDHMKQFVVAAPERYARFVARSEAVAAVGVAEAPGAAVAEWARSRGLAELASDASNGDQTCTLAYFVTLASQHGMLWLGVNIPGGYGGVSLNRLGVQLGASAQASETGVAAPDLATARHLGKRVAQFALRLAQHPGA